MSWIRLKTPVSLNDPLTDASGDLNLRLDEVGVADAVGVVSCPCPVPDSLFSVGAPGVVALVTEASARFSRKERAAFV